MAKYNLIKNGALISNTDPGTGNRSLNGAELYYLKDDVTTSSGVQLYASDVLYLDVDLGQRIKVDSIQLYADDLTQLGNIIFQYKNEETDIYDSCSESASEVSYVATIPEPSAPRYIRCIIIGLEINLYELKVLNDDYIIEFGSDGSETDVWVDDVPIGIPGDPQTIDIFNNSSESMPANAYVCVDYTGNGKDHYLKISNYEEGPYYGIDDDVVVGYAYKDWDTGSYNNTYRDTDNTVKMSSTGSSGYKGKIGPYPEIAIYQSTPFGTIQDLWSYDHIHNKIYFGIWTGSTYNNGVLKLYEYDIDTNVWSYKSLLQTDGSSYYSYRFTLCYYHKPEVLDPYSAEQNHIYYMPESNGKLYRHDLDGVQDNYVVMNDPSLYYRNYRSMISDRKGNLYYLTAHGDVDVDLARYDVSGNSWDNSLSISWDRQIEGNVAKICYDYDRDVIYLFHHWSDDGGWMQRYDVNTNTWIKQFWNLYTHIGEPDYFDMTYHNNKIYIASRAYDTTIYTYDLTTSFVDSIDVGWKIQAWGQGIIVIPPQDSYDDVTIYSARTYGDNNNFYGYNTGFESQEVDTTYGEGTYTTTIVSLEDQFNASYFIVDADTEEGKSSVSKDVDLFNGTIEVRSSDTVPITINEVYWPYKYDQDNTRIGRYIVGIDSFNSSWKDFTGSYYGYRPYPAAVDRRTGKIFSGEYRYDGTPSYFWIHDRAGTELYELYRTDYGTDPTTSKQPYFDGSHGIWIYMTCNSYLYHKGHDLSWLGSKSVASVYQIAAQLDSTGCWYTERSSNTLVKVLTNCTVDVTINMESPYGVCSTEDGGCWVSETSDVIYGYAVKRYDVDGNLLQTVVLDKPVYNLAHDNEDGFWARTDTSDGEVRHYNNLGVMDMKLINMYGVVYLSGGKEGCVAYASSYHITYYIDKATASVLWEKDYDVDIYSGSHNSSQIPALFSFDYDLQEQYVDDSGKLLPVSYDTLWYGDSNLEWQEVPKDGYFLPKHRYQQVRVTLRSQDASSTPILRSIAMAPAIKVTDILPQDSKPLYVRTDIPVGDTVSHFNTRIKVWWDIEE